MKQKLEEMITKLNVIEVRGEQNLLLLLGVILELRQMHEALGNNEKKEE